MPTRQWSAVILGRVWPRTDPEVLQARSDALRAKGIEMLQGAEGLRDLAQRTAANESGQFVNAFCDKQYQLAAIATHQADDGYFPMSRAWAEAANLVYGLREDLDEIDRQAEEDIQQLEQSPGPKAVIMARIFERVAEASAAADAKSAATMAAVAGVTNMFSSVNPTVTDPGSLAGDPGAVATGFGSGTHSGISQGFGGGGGRGPGNFPLSPALGGPPNPAHQTSKTGSDLSGSGDALDKSGGTVKPAGNGTNTGGDNAAGGTPANDLAGGGKEGGGPHQAGRTLNDLDAGGPSPIGTSTPPVMPASSSNGSGFSPPTGGGFKLPSSGGMGGGGGGMPAGLGSGFPQGLPSGLGGPGSMAPPPAPSAAPPPLSTDFSKGFGAGLGSASAGAPPPAAFAPVQPPPPPPGAGAPAGAMPTGPAPVAAAAGAPVSAPASAPVSTPAPSGPVGGGAMPSAPMGPLPPFGSDIPRNAPGAAGPTVAPASGAPSAPVPAGGGSTVSGPVAPPVPPGVVGSGVGASAGAAAEGIRSSLPDPLLESATRTLQQLLHDSKLYPFMDWAVGVFKTRSGVETIINNGDGLGYIPADMFVPRSARMLFADDALPQDFRSKWFAWANPAEPIIAYAKVCAEVDPAVELWALAVSTGIGGSVMPARAAGVPHFDEVTRFDSTPLADMAPSSQLDGAHMHRLETVDPAAYAQLTGVGDGPRPGQSKAWVDTEVAVRTVLERASLVRELAVPPVIREIMATLKDGVKPRPQTWETLREAMIPILGAGGGLRPGFGVDDAPASAFVRASHDLTRLCELLLLWEHGDVKLTELAYLTKTINSTPQV